jgi:RNA polymerase sigma-70 factor, ECF subfamily
MADLYAADEDAPEALVGRWRWRILRRAGLCEPLASRVAMTREIDLEQFRRLVGRGCDPVTAVRVLAPDDWAFDIPRLVQKDWRRSLVSLSAEPRCPEAAPPASVAALDPESRLWLDGLRDSGARHDACLARLHALLLRAARHEANRRRDWLGSVRGPELDDIAQQSADDALMTIVGRLDDFRGASRFTTWAYKFVMFEVSGKMTRHAWRDRPLALDETAWGRLPDRLAALPEDAAEQRELLSVLRRAVEEQLTDLQRRVFVSAALNDISIDALALEVGSNRNAVYKTLFDARRKLRASLAAAGHTLERSRS